MKPLKRVQVSECCFSVTILDVVNLITVCLKLLLVVFYVDEKC